MAVMRPHRLLAWFAVPCLTVASCAYVSPGVGFNTILGYEGLGWEIRRFYDRRAWERNATCPLARMDAILRAEVVEEAEDELVIAVRYSWRDETRLDDDDLFGPGARFGVGFGAGRCVGIDERLFTLHKVDGDVRVVEMSGPQRPEPIPR
jgi:hypothetical protein